MDVISVVVPVYRSSANVPDLLEALERLYRDLDGALEVVFVVDGSPDDSYLQLSERLPEVPYRAQLLALSRNFGSFAAIRAGLEAGEGERFAWLSADLQEPSELIVEIDRLLKAGEHDVVVGRRSSRRDPLAGRLASALFWALYRRFVQPELPSGGVDVFGCGRRVRDQILLLRENNGSIVGLLFWVGFRRVEVPYERRRRTAGKSAWTLAKRSRYLADSVFAFSDLPIRLLLWLGALGLATSVLFGLTVLFGKLSGAIAVPGYAATALAITFFGALNCFGLGVLGGYVWRTFENTKGRPGYIVMSRQVFPGPPPAEERP